MKKFVFLFTLALFTYTGNAQNQLNKLSTNPLQLFLGGLNNLEYERGFKEGKIGIAFYMAETGYAVPAIEEYNFFGKEQSFSIKFYRKGIDKNNFWFGGRLSLATGDIIYNLEPGTPPGTPEYDKFINNRGLDISTFAAGGVLGYQWIIKNFYVDVFGGVSYAITNDLFGKAQFLGEIEEVDVIPSLGLRTGISF